MTYKTKHQAYLPSATHGLRYFPLIVLGWAISMCGGCGVAGRGHNMQGVKLYQQGQHQAAIQKFEQAINRRPEDADGYYNLASTYYQLGKRNQDTSYLSQAEIAYNQALQYNHNHEDAYRGLAVLLVETGRPESAFKLLKGWEKRQPKLADAKVEVARLYDEFGDKETAVRYLEEALSVDTNSARAWTALAKLREETGDYAQALANYQRSFELNSLQPHVGERVASLQNMIGVTTAPNSTATTRVASRPWVPRSY
ncbi:MAG: tetratricopeptide repeat protein [Pirellulaceae bacterium]|nr:tetratricopeptide repeat protein [Pirellulaceae bacterium]